jgi:hypothetical protein
LPARLLLQITSATQRNGIPHQLVLKKTGLHWQVKQQEGQRLAGMAAAVHRLLPGAHQGAAAAAGVQLQAGRRGGHPEGRRQEGAVVDLT